MRGGHSANHFSPILQAHQEMKAFNDLIAVITTIRKVAKFIQYPICGNNYMFQNLLLSPRLSENKRLVESFSSL